MKKLISDVIMQVSGKGDLLQLLRISPQSALYRSLVINHMIYVLFYMK